MSRKYLLVFVAIGLLAVSATAMAAPATLSAESPESAEPGDEVTVSYTVSNTGDSTSSYVLDVTSLPSEWTVADRSDDGGEWQSSDNTWLWLSIESGAERNPSVTFSIPDDAEAGSYEIEALVEDSDTVRDRTTQTIEITNAGSGGDGESSGDGGDGDSSGDGSDGDSSGDGGDGDDGGASNADGGANGGDDSGGASDTPSDDSSTDDDGSAADESPESSESTSGGTEADESSSSGDSDTETSSNNGADEDAETSSSSSSLPLLLVGASAVVVTIAVAVIYRR